MQFDPRRKVAFAIWGSPSIFQDGGTETQVDQLLAEFIAANYVASSDSIQDVAECLAAFLRPRFERHRLMDGGAKMPWGAYCFGIYVAGYDRTSVPTAAVRVVATSTNTLDPGPPRVVSATDGLRAVTGGLPRGVQKRFWYGGTKTDRHLADEVLKERRPDEAAYMTDPTMAEWSELHDVIAEAARKLARGNSVRSVNEDVHGVCFDEDSVRANTTLPIRNWLAHLRDSR